MRVVTYKVDQEEQAGIAAPHGTVMLSELNRHSETVWPTNVMELLKSGKWDELTAWWSGMSEEEIAELPAIEAGSLPYAPLYRHPRKIWGIGFNYVKSEQQLAEIEEGFEPVGFLKPDTALIGSGDAIRIPRQSLRTIAEAELAVVIGKTCRHVSEEAAADYIAGYAVTIDASADDIHERNPRFLVRAKSFDTFFSLGPELVTPDEIGCLQELTVETVLNETPVHRNTIGNMICPPYKAVAFLSGVMTLLPGDIIMTGTPGAAVIREGDTMTARIGDFIPLVNGVESE